MTLSVTDKMLVKVVVVVFVSVSVVTLIGTGIGIGVFMALQNLETVAAEKEFLLTIEGKIEPVKSTISETERSVHTIRSLFSTVPYPMNPYTQFLPFIETSQSGIVGSYSLGWISKIKDNDREYIVNTTRRFGREYSTFEVTGRDSEGRLVPALKADTYYSLHYVYPLMPNLGALGFDLIREPIRRDAIQRSIEGKRDTVTGRIFLPHAKYQQPGILYLSPLFNGSELVGFGVGVFIIGDMVTSSLSDIFIHSDVSVFDIGLKASNLTTLPEKLSDSTWAKYNTTSFLWTNQGEYGPDFGSESHIRNIKSTTSRTSFQYVIHIEIGDRYWDVVFIPTETFLSKYRSGNKWIALFALIVGSLLVSAIGVVLAVIFSMRWHSQNRLHELEIKYIEMNAQRHLKFMNHIDKLNNARKHILDSIPDIVAVVNLSGKVIYANEMFYSILSLKTLASTTEINIHDIFSLEKVCFYTVTHSTPKETEIKPRIGTAIHVSYNSFPIEINEKAFGAMKIEEEQEEALGVVYLVHARDIRENKAMIDELKHNRNKLKTLLNNSEFDIKWRDDPVFREKLLAFAKLNKNEENILFMMDTDKYRNITKLNLRIEEKDKIMSRYILPNSQYQLNLISDVYTDVLFKANNDIADTNLFDVVYDSVKLTVATDLYPRMMKEYK